MRLLWFLAAYLLPASLAVADDEQLDRAYTNCMLAHQVKPGEITRREVDLCMRQIGVPDPGEATRQEKGQAWRDCLLKNAVRLDDGVSPASEVSRAVLGLCSEEWRAYVGALWLPPKATQDMASAPEKYAVNEGVRAVLFTRRVLQDRKAKP